MIALLCVHNLVNWPTVICLPNTCSFIGDLPLAKLGTPVHIHPSTIFHAISSVVTIAVATLLLLFLSYYCFTSVTSAFPGVAELTTQLLRLISILWLPLCWINKFGFYFPRRYSRIPYTCGSSRLFSDAVAREHSSTHKFTWGVHSTSLSLSLSLSLSFGFVLFCLVYFCLVLFFLVYFCLVLFCLVLFFLYTRKSIKI